MPSYTSKLGLRKPSLSDLVNVQTDVNDPATIIDRELPVRTIVDGLDNAAPHYQGQLVYETKKRRFSARVDNAWVVVDSPMAQRGRVKHIVTPSPAIGITNTLTLLTQTTYNHKANRNHAVEVSFSGFPNGGGGPFWLRVLVTIQTGAAADPAGFKIFDKSIRSPALNIDREVRTLGSVWFNTDVQKTIGVWAQTDGVGKTWQTHGSFPMHLLVRDIGAEIDYAP